MVILGSENYTARTVLIETAPSGLSIFEAVWKNRVKTRPAATVRGLSAVEALMAPRSGRLAGKKRRKQVRGAGGRSKVAGGRSGRQEQVAGAGVEEQDYCISFSIFHLSFLISHLLRIGECKKYCRARQMENEK
jgi:hypothetical protein